MTVLDTWYLLFKTDAGPAKAEVAALDKQIAELAAKGKKRSEEEQKQLKDLRKQRQEVTQDLKDQQRTVDATGQSFVKLAESAAAAGAAIVSLGAIKTGILDAAKFNSNLEVQGRIMGQNVTDLKAYGAAVEAAGGSVEGFLSTVRGAFSTAASAGLQLPPVDVLLRRYRESIKGLSKNEAARRLGLLGVTDPGLVSILEQSDEEFEKNIANAREHAAITEKDTHAAREFEAAWNKAAQSLDTLFSKIGSDVLPPITKLLQTFTEFTGSLQGNALGTYAFFGTLIVLSATLAKTALQAAKAVAGIGAAASGASVTSAFSRFLAPLANLGAAGWGSLLPGADAHLKAISPKYRKLTASRGESFQGGQSAIDFWVSQGYTREQAAGIVANEQRESGGNPNAVGDSGLARGLYQWHPDRVAKIKAATGIDVATASADDQRRAAAWELQNSGLADQLKTTTSPDQAADLFSRQFERPRNADSEAALRARLAIELAQQQIQLASATPLNAIPGVATGRGSDKTVNIKIGEINVQTNATDASGFSAAVSQELTSHLRSTVSNFDDGVAF